MAKIQVTSIEMRSKAQVIVLDTLFVAKAIKADCAAKSVDIDHLHSLNDWEKITIHEVFGFVRELATALLDEEEHSNQPEYVPNEGEE